MSRVDGRATKRSFVKVGRTDEVDDEGRKGLLCSCYSFHLHGFTCVKWVRGFSLVVVVVVPAVGVGTRRRM